MLKVFSKNSTDFSTLGLGVLNDFTDDPTITEVLNGEYYLEFTYKRDGIHIEHLIEQNIVVEKEYQTHNCFGAYDSNGYYKD